MPWCILVVDDDPAFGRDMVALLESVGVAVRWSRSAEEARTSRACVGCDAILSELIFGTGASGLELLAQLRREGVHVPFVILTAHGTIDQYKHALRIGASEFLQKPSSRVEIVSTLRRVANISVVAHNAVGHSPTTFRPADQHIDAAISTISQRFTDFDLSVATIARAVGVSADYLARLIRRQTGQSILHLLNRQRVDAAAKLLRDPDRSIYEVALDCGYRSTNRLDKWFKYFKGCTPTTWRGRARSLT